MFTGIVEELGSLVSSADQEGGARLVFASLVVSAGCAAGDSVAANGCCLTVVETGKGWWAADAVGETLARTNLGALQPGDPVNLERAMPCNGRFGGHLVQGHVDGVGEILAAGAEVRVRAPASVMAYVVPKGSVAVDGCSLTVVEVDDDSFSVALVPFTRRATTLGRKGPGDTVNLEADIVAKYVEKLLAAGASTPYRGGG